MSLMQTIQDFFESLFKRSSPEVQKKQLLKKLENEIKQFNPVLFRNGMLQPNFGEAVFVLYKNCRILDDLFSVTFSPNDIQRRRRFESQLVMTGYSPSEQEMIETLSYEARKEAVIAAGGDSREENRVYAAQRRTHENLIKNLNEESFRNMDREILQLRQLADFCRINFLPVLQLFDGNFIPGDMNYAPKYVEVPIEKVGNALEDIYYQASGLRITTGIANAVIALATLRSGGNLSDERREYFLSAIKKVAYTLNRILSVDRLKLLIQYEKHNEEYEPAVASYKGSPKQDFANLMAETFIADEKRIKSELQDAQIERELSSLFNGIPLMGSGSYNSEENEILRANSSLSFKYIFPFRILKTFVNVYLSNPVKNLLNDLVIEGFFVNPTYKKSFSDTVYSCLGIEEIIQNFEDSFGPDKPNSIAVLQGYIKDSHKDKDFYKKMEQMVHQINEEAKDIIQRQCANLVSLYKLVGELLEDSKRPSGEIIENLKVTMMSSRHREDSSFLEQTYGTWRIFFDIMKNYVIINTAV
ncbi:MAG: DUF5312 domain-containing protein [Treponema sp.]|nr:DUF5312 domain-containing protein [Treponema sp.]